jgi:hypothetical protein
MRKASTFHDKAMFLAEMADKLRATNAADARGLYRQAFEMERSAAFQFLRKTGVEPTRSVLFRSAASLALECDDFIEAERMICHGLAAEPPVDIRIELRHLYEQMHFRLFLQETELDLIEHQIVVSLWGEGVAPDFVLLREVLERLKKAERLIYRTAERKCGLPFDEESDSPQAIRRQFPIYQRMQMAASYAVVLQIGQTDRQLALPFHVDAAAIVSEVIDCLALYACANISELHERIDDSAYRRNFESLAKSLYPKKKTGISGVGIAGRTSDGKMKAIELVEPPQMQIDAALDGSDTGEVIQIVGVLYFAKSTERTRRVEIKDDAGNTHPIDVQEGMMADVVRPFFEARVVADVSRSINGKLRLIGVNLESDNPEGHGDANA